MENTDCIKKIYLVGGAVRDTLLGIPIRDKDYVAVGFSEADFSHLRKVGKTFPVFLQEDGTQIALARRETKTQRGYNGFSTQTDKVSLQEDLKRRDLTINAIALDEETNVYYDPFNGIKDLREKTLRHISESFCEDPLRVLRVARFRAQFGISWKIHSTTKVLIYTMREELHFLEKNRVYKEVEAVLSTQNSYLFFETLFELGVLDIIFPHIYTLTTLKEGNLHHLESSAFAHTMQVLKEVESQKVESQKVESQKVESQNSLLILKFAALYHDIAKPYCYRNYGNSSNHDSLELVCKHIDISIPNSLRKPMLILIQNHIKIYSLQEMRPSKIVRFFEKYKRDSTLLELQISLLIADKIGRISLKPLKDSCLNPEFHQSLIQTFNALKTYSPREWLATKQEVSKKAIQMHILKEKIKIVQQIFKSYNPKHHLANS